MDKTEQCVLAADSQGHSRILSLVVLALLFAGASFAHADATFLLQEPYGRLGALSPTGHAAIYLSRICAESPAVLRRCAPGETGAVISRYRSAAGRDWIAVPLIPYLYAVDDPAQAPASVDADAANLLRDDYRRRHLSDLFRDGPEGKDPGGSWIELVGAAYNRKIYAFQIETTEAQDDKLLEQLNSRPNKKRFNFLFNNCADFARRIMNSYFPGAVRRSYIADMGLMTPKQIAKSLVKYGIRNPDIQLSVYVIPQVPGDIHRSAAVHGVAESLLKTKKYVVPLAFFHPFLVGGIATAYFVKGRFNPGREATVIASMPDLELVARTRSDTISGGVPRPFRPIPKNIGLTTSGCRVFLVQGMVGFEARCFSLDLVSVNNL